MTVAPEITVTCSKCHNPIADGDGVLEVDVLAAQEREIKNRERQAPGGPVNVGELLADSLGPVPWRAWHHDCDPNGDAFTYHFTVERIRYLGDLFGWVAHLGEKPWVSATNWSAVIRQIGRAPTSECPPVLSVDRAVLAPRESALAD